MSRPNRWPRIIVVIGLGMILGGCAGPASREGMTVTGATVTKSSSTVSVRVTGGVDEAQGPNVGNDDMKAAIEASIRSSGLFRSIASPDRGDYDLAVFITRIDRPSIGLNFTVEMEAGWSLTRVADRAVLMRKVVKSTATATFSDAVAGATRIRLAVEGAARNNIEAGLQAVGALDLR